MREKPSSHSCLPICRGTNSGGRSLGTRATTASDRFPAGISSSPWRLPNSADGNLCAISRLAFLPIAKSSTTSVLCLSLSPGATFRKTKAAVKMHTLLDLRGSIPTFVGLTSGAVHDVHFLDVVPLEEESVVTMDRGYSHLGGR